ncbi:MAG: hypothetical protein AABY22_12525 [Nanoarchaeota archaeon]
MSKRFEEFWNNDANFERFVTTQGFCLAAWDACKKEIIKELKRDIRNYSSDQDGYDFDAIPIDIIDKIEKEF